jgi:hypothetical protein
MSLSLQLSCLIPGVQSSLLIDVSDTDARIKVTGHATELNEFFLILTNFGIRYSAAVTLTPRLSPLCLREPHIVLICEIDRERRIESGTKGAGGQEARDIIEGFRTRVNAF